MLIQDLPPLDWAMTTIQKNNKSEFLSRKLTAKILTVALPIFEIYTSLHLILQMATSLFLSLKRITFFSLNFIEGMGRETINIMADIKNFLYPNQSSKMKAFYIVSGLIYCLSLVVLPLELPVIVGGLAVYFALISIYICAMVKQLIKNSEDKTNILLKLKIKEDNVNIKQDSKKVIYALLNCVIAPVLGLASDKMNYSYHQKTGLIASEPKTFEELKQTARHFSTSNGFKASVSIRKCRTIIATYLNPSSSTHFSSRQMLKFAEIIKDTNLIKHLTITYPDLIKEFSQLEIIYSEEPSKDMLSALYSNSKSGFSISKKLFKDFILNHPHIILYAVLEKFKYVDSKYIPGQKEVELLPNKMTIGQPTFLKSAIKGLPAVEFFAKYPYIQDKLKQMHATHAIETIEPLSAVKIFKKMLKDDFKNFIQSGEAVETCLLLSDFKFMKKIARNDAKKFENSLNALIQNHSVVRTPLICLKTKILGLPIHKFLRSNEMKRYNDIEILVT